MRLKAIALSLLLAGVSLAADVTGKWTSTVQGKNGQSREVVYNLKADGDKLTGTATGFRGQELQITDGKVDGANVSFTTKVEFNGNTRTIQYKGKISGDELKLTQSIEGMDQTREIVAKRAK